jgi:hypothetical protein
MRRIVLAVIVLLAAGCRLASAAAISVAGADCGTDPLLGLSFKTLTGTNLPLTGSGAACPADGMGLGAIIGEPGSGESGPLYGPAITSIEFDISNPLELRKAGLDILEGSELTHVSWTNTGFILTGDPGITIGCTSLDIEIGRFCSPSDALITFSGFAPNTTFTVAAVNGIPAPVPEPATLSLLAVGAAAAAAIRRRRR